MAREVKFPAQISALVPQEIRDRIDALEKAHPISGGDVIREALAEGLTSVERRFAVEAHSAREAERREGRQKIRASRGSVSVARDLEPLEVMNPDDVEAYTAAGGEL